jgi:hypothetical protein
MSNIIVVVNKCCLNIWAYLYNIVSSAYLGTSYPVKATYNMIITLILKSILLEGFITAEVKRSDYYYYYYYYYYKSADIFLMNQITHFSR